MDRTGSVLASFLGKTALFLAVLILTASISEKELLLLPAEIREPLGLRPSAPLPSYLVVSTGDESFQIYPTDIDLTYKWNGNAYEPNFSVEKLDSELASLSELTYRPACDAVLNITDLSVVPDVSGRDLDVEATRENVRDLLERTAFDELATASFNEIVAERRAADYEGFDTKPIGEYTTKFKKWQAGRNYNIALCASHFNGLIVYPGEEISFNTVTGDRTYDTGYKSAPVIENQEVVPGVGGGSCQVSTTLYNAVCLEAGIPTTERWPHGLQVAYVPWNRDATVAYPQRDFKFINTYSSPILITCEIIENALTFRVFTKKGAVNNVPTELAEKSANEKAKTAHPPKPKPKPPTETKPETPSNGSGESKPPPIEQIPAPAPPPSEEPPNIGGN